MRNIIITGGELFNKGAQAMTFVAVDEICRRFPDHQILLLSELDLERPEAEKSQYRFGFIGWYPIKFARCQSDRLLRIACMIRNPAELKKAESIYRNCDAMVDVSGYALGTVWSDATCNRYLDHLEFAKEFGIPVYLMPQSFGPFDFGEERKDLDARIRRLLPTVKVIFAREEEGYHALVERYGLTTVRLAPDLVLSNKGIDIDRVFQDPPRFDVPDIADNSVAVVPNSMNTSVANQKAVISLYAEIIRTLRSLDKKVYLLSHSSTDKTICRTVKDEFADNKDVVLLEQDFSCLEFNRLVQQFQYVVASRFHSVVHAYKNGIPCIVLGWAPKYHALLKLFGQEKYAYDVRNGNIGAELAEAVIKMNDRYPEESARIKAALASVQEQNVFDVLSEQ